MLPAQPSALSQADLIRLDAFLHSSACGREAMGLSHAHGFLTAAASGPEQLEPGEWLRLVFDEPVFANGEQAQDMLGLALRLYQDIEARLGQPGSFAPVLDFVATATGRALPDATAWCRGYLSGMSLCREPWDGYGGWPLDRGLAPIIALSQADVPSPDEHYRYLCDALPGTAEAIYRYWREQTRGECDQA